MLPRKVIFAIVKQLMQLQRLQRDSNPDPRDTGAMLYRLSYEASLKADQARGPYIPFI